MEFEHKTTGKSFKTSSIWMRISRMRKRVFSWADALDGYIKLCGHTHRLVMVRLSYHDGDDWKPKHISKYVTLVKRKLKDNLLGYVWVAELQKRGAIHYHVLFLVRRGTKIEKPDDSGQWNYGSSRIETAKTPYYICEYVGKEYQKNGKYPFGARVCGAYLKRLAVTDSIYETYREACYPKWIKESREAIRETGWLEGPGSIKRAQGGFLIEGAGVVTSPWDLITWRDEK